ncbi:hypothetical protein ACERZ8_01725 [Tateyamaria armeniaca]|uniref:Uncharacterized protein n=1 Tax=Tateyamaria armeniaca TaxID=2518930 RepID=A0ABW8UNF9_9RHOB
MRKAWAIIPSLLVLGACGDPLAGVERVSDGVAFPDSVVTTALPTEDELARETSILSGLFRKRAEPEELLADVGTTDIGQAANDGVTVVSDMPVEALPDDAETSAIVTASADSEPRRKGVFGWLRRDPVSEAAPVSNAEVFDGTDEGDDLDLDIPGNAETDPQIEDVQVASLSPESAAVPAPELVEPQKRRRLFGRAAPAPAAGMALRDVDPGAVLPFGEVARVCDVRTRDLGKLVEQAAGKGRGYNLFDSAPNSAEPRSFFVTGFGDNCARQFTAELAIFGTPEFHEQLRYGLPASEYPYSTTDRAYEKVKAKVCNVGRNKPCGPRISRLEKTTAFVSVYEHFGDNGRWADMLLHDGALLAMSVKTP